MAGVCVCVACGQKPWFSQFPRARSSFLEKKELMFCLVLPQLQGRKRKVGGGRAERDGRWRYGGEWESEIRRWWCGWEQGLGLTVAQRWGVFIGHRGSFTGPSVESGDWEVGASVHSASPANTATSTQRDKLQNQTKTPPNNFYTACLSHFPLAPSFLLTQLKCVELS